MGKGSIEELVHLKSHLQGILQPSTLLDYYSLSSIHFSTPEAHRILEKYGGSHYNVLKDIFPDHQWLPWRFNVPPPRLWENRRNQSLFLRWLGDKLGFKRAEDWYKVQEKDFVENGGAVFFNKFNNSAELLLYDLYPDHKWEIEKFPFTSNNNHNPFQNRAWHSRRNQLRFLEKVAKSKNFQSLDDWYQISVADIQQLGGGGLLNLYKKSTSKMLMSVYNQHNWLPWLFSVTPLNYWSSPQNQHTYMDWLGKKLGFTANEDWYKLTREHLRVNHGQGLIKKYDFSASKMVTTLFPQHTWKYWKFVSIPMDYWNNIQNQREYLEDLAEQLGHTKYEDWYSVTAADLMKHHGNALLKRFKGSPSFLITSVFKEHPWEAWRFKTRNFGMSDHDEVVERFVQNLARELNIEKLEDWYRISPESLPQWGLVGAAFLSRNGGLIGILKKCYPSHQWEEERFTVHRTRKVQQRALEEAVKAIFPGLEIVKDYSHPELVFAGTNELVELDVYVSSRQVAFEFQGFQHYQRDAFYRKATKEKEDQKRELSKRAGITLIEVPYWWDQSITSLREIISDASPELLL